jgi:hypothetical protein
MSVAVLEGDASLASKNVKRKRNRASKDIYGNSKASPGNGTTGLADENGNAAVTPGVNADLLAWKKISLQNDEFADFEEIEGVDVEYVKKDGHNVLQLKESPLQNDLLTTRS